MVENFNDVSDAFDGWLQTLTGTRNASGSYVNGRWVPGSSGALSFNGVVQNALPDDLIVLPENLRSSETIKIHTTFELIPLDESTGQTGDLINYRSKTYLVHNVADRMIGGYFKALAIRQ